VRATTETFVSSLPIMEKEHILPKIISGSQ
jgi:hypothetical protein